MNIDATTLLLADLLHCDEAECSTLGATVYEKTYGNSFYLMQLLKLSCCMFSIVAAMLGDASMIISRNKYLEALKIRMHNNMIKVVTGIRRCGKSYLVFKIFKNYLIDSGTREDHIIMIELDQRKNREYRDPDAILEYIDSLIKDEEQYYILLDEIQMLKEFEEVLNSLLHIQNADVYVTGSNSKFLSKDIITEFSVCFGMKNEGDKIIRFLLDQGFQTEGIGVERVDGRRNIYLTSEPIDIGDGEIVEYWEITYYGVSGFFCSVTPYPNRELPKSVMINLSFTKKEYEALEKMAEGEPIDKYLKNAIINR